MGWMVDDTPQPFYHRERNPVPTVYVAGTETFSVRTNVLVKEGKAVPYLVNSAIFGKKLLNIKSVF
jgi:hypothetical protein